ncbi:hypothetical protein [Thermococcus sp.]|uniref:hypothetical protein n=1 Tax=Thermococcus sp. TaxID=35749 RepID=UPI002624E3B9|nr:hypothetical protein [Thermococcus sp.]
MKCKHLMVPVLLSLLLLFIVIGFFWEFSTALQVALLNLIAMSILQLATSGYKNGPGREGYIIGAFTFFFLNFGMLGNGVKGLIFATVLTGLILCVYEVAWFKLWKGNSTVKSNLLWLLAIAGILYLAYLEGIRPLLSAVFIIGVILVGYVAFKKLS